MSNKFKGLSLLTNPLFMAIFTKAQLSFSNYIFEKILHLTSRINGPVTKRGNFFKRIPQQNTTDAEIKVPSAENPKLSRVFSDIPRVGQNIASHASPGIHSGTPRFSY